MSESVKPGRQKRTGLAIGRLLIVILGIAVGQFILYGPSLIGKKILLPLDTLALPNVYLPHTQEVRSIVPQDVVLTDAVLQFEPARRFAADEIKAGRFPLWAPYQYGGAPVIWPKYSPFLLLSALTTSPRVLPWVQLLAALVAGIGAYAFFRRALGVGFWPAAICAWCYPLTGFFIFWQGLPTGNAVYWFPWLLLAVDRVVHRSELLAACGLAIATALTLASGHIDVAGQALLMSGLFGIGRLVISYRLQLLRKEAGKAVLLLSAGWALGFLLAAPHVLPLLDYARTSNRIERRSAGAEERPPVGLAALPQAVLPDLYGSSLKDSFPLFPDKQRNLQESSAAAYAGVLAALLAAPLAWSSRKHRPLVVLWVLLGFIGLAWCLNIPGIVQILRMPFLHIMSHNRLVFATCFAILALAAIGLELLSENGLPWRWWHWCPAILLAGLCAWYLLRSANLPEPVRSEMQAWILKGQDSLFIHNQDDVRRVQAWFIQRYSMGAIFCGLGAMTWVLLRRKKLRPSYALPVFGVLMMSDLIWFAHGRSPQCDPALYYPRLPVLDAIAKTERPGRILGYRCLPATLSQTHGLRDIRGYDSLDPGHLVSLLDTAADPAYRKMRYAATQWFYPRMTLLPPDGIRLPPVLDMLNVQYVVFRGSPPAQIRPVFQDVDYWAVTNHRALPPVFVPRRVATVSDDRERLKRLADSEFNPRDIAYVEDPVNLPSECRGAAQIVHETPTRISISVDMETPGLLVLADLWHKGWRASVDGRPVPILRVNHALRGIVLPASRATVEFHFDPGIQKLSWTLSAGAMVVLVVMAGAQLWNRRVRKR